MWKIFQHINIIFLRSLNYREVIYIVGWSQTGRIIWCSVALINIEWWWWVHCDDDDHWCAGGEEMLETGDAGEWLQVSGVTLMRVLSVGEWSCKHWLSLTTRNLTRELWEQEAASLSLSDPSQLLYLLVEWVQPCEEYYCPGSTLASSMSNIWLLIQLSYHNLI